MLYLLKVGGGSHFRVTVIVGSRNTRFITRAKIIKLTVFAKALIVVYIIPIKATPPGSMKLVWDFVNLSVRTNLYMQRFEPINE